MTHTGFEMALILGGFDRFHVGVGDEMDAQGSNRIALTAHDVSQPVDFGAQALFAGGAFGTGKVGKDIKGIARTFIEAFVQFWRVAVVGAVVFGVIVVSGAIQAVDDRIANAWMPAQIVQAIKGLWVAEFFSDEERPGQGEEMDGLQGQADAALIAAAGVDVGGQDRCGDLKGQHGGLIQGFGRITGDDGGQVDRGWAMAPGERQGDAVGGQRQAIEEVGAGDRVENEIEAVFAIPGDGEMDGGLGFGAKPAEVALFIPFDRIPAGAGQQLVHAQGERFGGTVVVHRGLPRRRSFSACAAQKQYGSAAEAPEGFPVSRRQKSGPARYPTV